MRLLKSPRVLAAVVFVGGVMAFAFWPESVEVDIARVTRGPMQVTIDEEGETRVRERFVVSAPVAGRLQRMALEPGDRVERGRTVVARISSAAAPLIDPRSQAELTAGIEAARDAVGQARAERERAAAALTRAQASVRRLQPLAKAGAVSTDELEVAETAQRTAEEAVRASGFAVARAEHELELAQARLAPSAAGGRTLDVTAPVDGVVLKRLRESETVVPAGEPLLEIGDPASLEIVADFLSTDAVRIPGGAEALIERWGGAQPVPARVRRVDPSGFMKVSALGVEEQRVNVVLDLVGSGASAPRLGDGFRVEVRVVIWREAAALKVPAGTVFRRGDAWMAFVVDNGRARLRPVTLGQRNETEVQVLEGLAEGEPLVLHPPDTLADGERVIERP